MDPIYECINLIKEYISPNLRKLLIISTISITIIYLFVDIKINSKEYLRENGNYYQLFNDEVNWDQAKIECEKIGGHLVTISDEAENNIVKSIMGYSSIWLGGYKYNDSWMWVSNEDFKFENWSEGEPNNNAGREIVIVMLTDGSWNDGTKLVYNPDYTTNGLSYICEWENKINIIINIFDLYWSYGIL